MEIADEKTRLKRAEQRLLPSEPPIDDGPGASASLQPSAPEAIDDEDFVHRYRMHQTKPSVPSLPPTETVVIPAQCNWPMDTEPSLATFARSPERNDDKQEVEMRRLQDQASSPEGVEGLPTPLEPTAPTLDRQPSYDAHCRPSSILDGSESENLPMYRK